jgi:hypothetical protein
LRLNNARQPARNWPRSRGHFFQKHEHAGVAGPLGGGRAFKLLEHRGQTFGDGLLGSIQLGPERSPDFKQPRHSPCALINAGHSTTVPFVLASSVKLRGIDSHDDLCFTTRTLCDSSRSASAQYMSASFRYRRLSRSDFVTTVSRAYSFALGR